MEHELKSSQGFVVRAEKECDVYCPICRKILHVQEGQVIPRCCGKPMQVMDGTGKYKRPDRKIRASMVWCIKFPAAAWQT